MEIINTTAAQHFTAVYMLWEGENIAMASRARWNIFLFAPDNSMKCVYFCNWLIAFCNEEACYQETIISFSIEKNNKLKNKYIISKLVESERYGNINSDRDYQISPN